MPEENTEQPLPLPDAASGRPATDAEASSRGLLRILLLGPRTWKRWWNALVRTVSHKDILAKNREDAAFSFNYAFMVTVSSGIATIGLLLDSPAVIIGAMLISPLMGPIVGTGFAIAGFDVEMGKSAARTLMLGTIAAVLFAAAIVLLSPVKDLTHEIVARTRPNLFDLAVAILSGAAGGYAMIRGRGGAIVGVAIATALMPPLAVIGYGLATLQWSVARGALLLFVTNMVAIALAVAIIAEWYGFGRGGLRKRFARQALIALVFLAPLAIPLYLSLKSIAWESRVQSTVRAVLEAGAKRLKHGQVAQVNVRFRHDEAPFVDAIIVSEEAPPGLDARLRGEMEKALGTSVQLDLTQLHADEPAKLATELEARNAEDRATREQRELAAALHNEVPFPLAAVDVDPVERTAVVVPLARSDVGLSAWRAMETALAGRHAGWQLKLVPPAAALPGIDFASGDAGLTAAAEQSLEVVAWALGQWGVDDVRLVAHAEGRSAKASALAKQRLAGVDAWFSAHGISTRPSVEVPPRAKTVGPVGPAVDILLPPPRAATESSPAPR